ncbi:MAG: helicase, partial [Rhodobacteraceae bacterium]|nr:helicase [Paracoccaceae bacterium]
MERQARVTAVLGPTNTGKTHYAIERMLAHRTGVIGLPLRLLAREVYDRILALRGPSVVALVTGEERIVPERACYWVCTVEAMPVDIGADFLAVDEIQLCADPERGHVFTDRLMNARGLQETMFLGSETMRGAIAALVPRTVFIRRDRFSALTHTGEKKLSRMPPRSAIVGFSVESVYAIAEFMRRQKGGCAVVMGALSPRTRNAQVALYQAGDVDYLIATDAIGMGLNLDIHHVAFSNTAKFDGRRIRQLIPNELAQIAGRAGRHMTPGSFGTTGEARPLPDEVVEAIESHQFTPVRKLEWRNAALNFASPERLIRSLEAPTSDDWLSRTRDADDLVALKALAANPAVRPRVAGPADTRLLWEVCRIPDFRSISEAEHAGLLARIWGFLQDGGQVPEDWLARNIARIDRQDGDLDAISRRLAYIRTWTYVAQRPGWVADEGHWREVTRAVEDRLSDALHARLTQRFVDRRTSVLMRRLKERESLVAEVNDKGEVSVEGEFAGRLEGFRFHMDATATQDAARTLRQAAYEALRPEFALRADRFYNTRDAEIDFTTQGGLMWGTAAVGKLVAGPEPMKPGIDPFVDEEAGPEVAEKVRRRLQHFMDRKVAALFEPLVALQRDETLAGLARGFAFRLVESLGVLPREGVTDEVKALDQDARAALRKHGVRFGQYTVFLPQLLKPAPTRLRLVLWSLAQGLKEFPESPPPGLVTIPNLREVPRQHYTLAGYRPAGARAIRIDMLERLADLLRARDSRAGFEASPEMLSITGMTLDQFADLMGGLGYRAERGERPKPRPAAPVPAAAPAAADAPLPAAAAPEAAGEMASGEPDAPTTGVPVAAPPAPSGEPAADGAAAEAPAAVAASSHADAPPSDGPAAGASAAEAEAGAGGETEVFITFTWAPRRAPA